MLKQLCKWPAVHAFVCWRPSSIWKARCHDAFAHYHISSLCAWMRNDLCSRDSPLCTPCCPTRRHHSRWRRSVHTKGGIGRPYHATSMWKRTRYMLEEIFSRWRRKMLCVGVWFVRCLYDLLNLESSRPLKGQLAQLCKQLYIPASSCELSS